MKSPAKERRLLYGIYMAGAIALIVFVVTKNEFLMEKATETMFDEGDLYRFAKVRDFKSEFPPSVEEEQQDLDPDEQTLFLVGDSFSNDNRGHQPFTSLLADTLGRKIYTYEAGNTPEMFNPVYFFKMNNVRSGPDRIFILQRIERYIVPDLAPPMDDDPAIEQPSAETFSSRYHQLEDRMFVKAEQNYQIFLTSSSITSPLVEWYKTGVFHLLGEISSMTPMYSLHPPFLFYYEETNRDETSFYYHHSDTLISAIADNLEMLNDAMQSTYNATLVFMPVPNKYTIYHKFVNNDVYDDFLPRLCDEAERRGVHTIRLYERFIDSKKILYYPSDSHWNLTGMNIALDETAKVLRSIMEPQ